MPSRLHDDRPQGLGVHSGTERLRAARRDNGITLPSLAGTWLPALVALGKCTTATARKLTEALRRAAAR
ncbi:hypothetical protein ACGFOU_30915 [Streptomyces sp. NPDC048595]|uniref:hypothetical protein n=1 Tax=Streptomyces sp. NPDC048595 TaxID=3365576 RepID=UPI00370FA64A